MITTQESTNLLLNTLHHNVHVFLCILVLQ